MTLLHRRAASRSCRIHGDNGCELQGDAGPRERAQDDRAWRAQVYDELLEAAEDSAAQVVRSALTC